MNDPFESPKRKLARAHEHIANFKEVFAAFANSDPYRQVIEADANTPQKQTHKIRLVKSIPSSLDVIAADIVNNLRTVLDQTVHSVATASGHLISHAKFPFAGDATKFERIVSSKSEYLPQEIVALLRGFKTYRGGNDLLCALNDWCNTDKHALIAAAENSSIHLKTAVSATGFMSTPQRPTWDRSKHEIELFSVMLGVTERFEYDFEFLLFVSFDQIESIRGQEAIRVFYAFASEVERVLMAIEAEWHRICDLKVKTEGTA